MAEDLVGEGLRKRGREAEADEHQGGNRHRAGLFLRKPSDVSLIIAIGQGTLEERGPAWLFLEYLRGQAGSNSVLRSVTGTTLTSTVNVERSWGVTGQICFRIGVLRSSSNDRSSSADPCPSAMN